MRILIAASEIILIPFTIMVCIEFVFVIFLGDFCMDPMNILLSFTDGDVKDNIEFFVTCDSAKNPFTDYKADILSALSLLALDCNDTPFCTQSINSLTYRHIPSLIYLFSSRYR
jgi:hypothetical protein